MMTTKKIRYNKIIKIINFDTVDLQALYDQINNQHICVVFVEI
jgi:hypothetical protein